MQALRRKGFQQVIQRVRFKSANRMLVVRAGENYKWMLADADFFQHLKAVQI